MMPKLTAKQQYWSEQLLQADAFDGSLAEYAHAQNIPAQTLYRWRSYFRQTSITERETRTVFTQVVSTPIPGPCLKLMMGNIQLQFTRLPDPQWLAEFVAASHTP